MSKTRAYVSAPQLNSNGHQIHVLNLQTFEPEKTIDTGPFSIPHGMVLRNDTLWYTAQGSKSVVAYSLKEGKPLEVFSTGQDFTHLLYLSRNGKAFYTTNVESDTLSTYR